jgi:hypothetical protein
MKTNKVFNYVTPFLLLSTLSLVAPNLNVHRSSAAPTARPLSDACSTSNNTFQSGEEITYKIYYNWNFVWLSAGEVTFKVWDEGSQYHYQALGKTYNSYEWFFTVDDRYDSWVDKNTLLPNYSERSVNEGKYHIFEKIAFNQAGRRTTVTRAEKRGGTETVTNFATKECVHDVLSSMFFLRNVDFASQSTGYKVPFHIFMDQEEFPLQMRYRGVESRKKVHNMGRYNTLKFQPDVIVGNVFKEDAKMTVWVSNDQNRIPILIESPVSVGTVKVVLKNYKGLKYDFTAKID